MKTSFRLPNSRCGFTLIEVILVVVVITIISVIALPHFSSSLKGSKLRHAGRTIQRMARYARSMAIMREETLTVVLNHQTMEVFLGGYVSKTNSADGELDQDVLKRLGYVDGDGQDSQTGGIDKEVHKFLPDGLTVKSFDKNQTEEDDRYPDLYMVRFFPNGQCEWFEMELEDHRGTGIRLENDPVSGKVASEMLQ